MCLLFKTEQSTKVHGIELWYSKPYEKLLNKIVLLIFHRVTFCLFNSILFFIFAVSLLYITNTPNPNHRQKEKEEKEPRVVW